MARYLDLDVILAEEDRVPFKFLLDADRLGHLHPTVQEEDLPKDTEVELPVWLGKAFYDRNMVAVELPKHFKGKMRDHLLAGADAVNLKELSPYYFDVGVKLTKMRLDGNDNKDSDDLLRCLRRAFCGERFRQLCVLTLTKYVVVRVLRCVVLRCAAYNNCLISVLHFFPP